MGQNEENRQKQAKNSKEGRCTADLQVGTAVHHWPKPRTAVRGGRAWAVRCGTAVRGDARPCVPAWVRDKSPFSGVCSREEFEGVVLGLCSGDFLSRLG